MLAMVFAWLPARRSPTNSLPPVPLSTVQQISFFSFLFFRFRLARCKITISCPSRLTLSSKLLQESSRMPFSREFFLVSRRVFSFTQNFFLTQRVQRYRVFSFTQSYFLSRRGAEAFRVYRELVLELRRLLEFIEDLF